MELNEIVLTDEALNVIDSGAWVDDIEGAPGLRLFVIGLTSKDAKKALEQKQAALRMKNRGKQLTNEQLANCTREVLAEVVLKNWEGLTQDGKPVEFSPELAAKWILSRNGERFTGMVLQASQQVDANASEYIKEVSKN